MAKLEGTIQLTGSVQNLSFYKMRGSDKIIIRRKGGPSKKQVKNAKNFENTRRNNMEFGGRALAAATIKSYLHPLLFLADYNIVGPLNALLRTIQKMDTTSGWGKRHVLLTKQPRLLEGFTLNRRYLLETIVRTPVVCNLQGEQVHIDLPALVPGINFMSPGNYPYFRFIGTAGLVPDICYTEHGYMLKYKERSYFEYAQSDWLPVNAPASASTLILKGMPANKPADCSIMVALGVAFGKLKGDTIVPEKYVGGAKVLIVV
ncbi:hypothetical protein [Niastella sp. OAS944]|uniref:hypothetical protein n=1 Tax=Niastella sp. OAS944 TaxID=2664089 RepID=UPI003492AFC6|nr:hypothetical protein [Chitinophagaceae bacterium OAS944]